jgi:hypothetical protein
MSTEAPEYVQLNFPIPAELHRELKLLAASDGMSLRNAVVLVLWAGLHALEDAEVKSR